MHRAKHRAAASSTVLATTLIERFAVVPGPRPESTAPRHGVATLPRTTPPTVGETLFGGVPRTAPALGLRPDDAAPARDASPLFDEAGRDGDDPADTEPTTGPLFGAARHARARRRGAGAPAVPAARVAALPSVRLRPQPVGATLSVTVLGAAAAVTAVVSPGTGVETTGSLAPVQSEAPAPAFVGPVAPALAAPAAAAGLPDQPTMQVGDLVTHVTGEMQKVVDLPYQTVAHSEALTSPAAMRRAAMTNALGKLGTPYRWGAMGPNAFDCSGLVKWSFANAGRSLPRTSRAMANVGVPVARADLQPGDLVFFYSPISHVGIYIGNGKIVHASRSGQPVKISDISYMRYTTARRV